MAKIRLWLRVDKINKNGFAPVYVITSEKGWRKYKATDIRLRPINWDIDTQKAVYHPESDRTFDMIVFANLMLDCCKDGTAPFFSPRQNLDSLKQEIDFLTDEERIELGNYCLNK